MMHASDDVAGPGVDEAMAAVSNVLRRSVVRVRSRGREGGGAGARVQLDLVRGGRMTRVDLRVPGMAEAA